LFVGVAHVNGQDILQEEITYECNIIHNVEVYRVRIQSSSKIERSNWF
jgi:hypothetical protein